MINYVLLILVAVFVVSLFGINDEWTKYCHKINTDWAELLSKDMRSWSDMVEKHDREWNEKCEEYISEIAELKSRLSKYEDL